MNNDMFFGRGFMPIAMWDSVSTPAREEAEADVCARLRAGWRPNVAVFDDLADDLEYLAREDWNPRRSVRYAGGTSSRCGQVDWDGIHRTKAGR